MSWMDEDHRDKIKEAINRHTEKLLADPEALKEHLIKIGVATERDGELVLNSEDEKHPYPIFDKVLFGLHQTGHELELTADWGDYEKRNYIRMRFDTASDCSEFIDLMRTIEYNQEDLDVKVFSSHMSKGMRHFPGRG